MKRMRIVVLLCCGLLAGMGLQIAASDNSRGHGHKRHQGHKHHQDREESYEEEFDPHFPFGDVRVGGTGMLGVGPNQTARLHVVNVGQAPNSCTVEMTFLDSTGAVLTQSTEALAPGAASSLDLEPGVLVGGPIPTHRTFRTLARLIDGTGCVFMPSVETIDTDTGRTIYAQPGTNGW